MYVCMYVCIFLSIYVYEIMNACMYVSMYVCMYVCMYVWEHVNICIYFQKYYSCHDRSGLLTLQDARESEVLQSVEVVPMGPLHNMSGQCFPIGSIELPVCLPLALVVGLVVHDGLEVDGSHSRVTEDMHDLGSSFGEVDVFVVFEEIDVAVLLRPAVQIFRGYVGHLCIEINYYAYKSRFSKKKSVCMNVLTIKDVFGCRLL